MHVHRLLISVAVLAAAATACSTSGTADRDGVRVDAEKLRVLEDRLQPALEDFRVLGTPAQFKPIRAAQITECASDDFGYAGQPLALAEWGSTRPKGPGAGADRRVRARSYAGRAAEELAAGLTSRGWTRKARQDGVEGIVLNKKMDGYTIEGRILTYLFWRDNTDQLSVIASADAPEPCSGSNGN